MLLFFSKVHILVLHTEWVTHFSTKIQCMLFNCKYVLNTEMAHCGGLTILPIVHLWITTLSRWDKFIQNPAEYILVMYHMQCLILHRPLVKTIVVPRKVEGCLSSPLICLRNVRHNFSFPQLKAPLYKETFLPIKNWCQMERTGYLANHILYINPE